MTIGSTGEAQMMSFRLVEAARKRASLIQCLAAGLLITACNGDVVPSPPRTATLLIAPLMQGEYYCDDAVNNPNVQTEDDAALLCASLGKNGAERINATLSALGPASSPSGKYQLGYTLEIPTFRYFKKTDTGWVFDGLSLAKNLTTISDVDRPVVVFISADHFVDSNLALAADLASDSQNLMWDRDGPLVPDAYFANPIAAWTLVDKNAAVNTMRRAAFGAILNALCALPPAAQSRITAVGILGEIIELIPDLTSGPAFDVPMYDSADYAPLAVSEFRDWLARRFGTIGSLSAAIGANFTTFSSINPPSRNIFAEQATSYLDHIDAAASGTVAVYGWLYDALGRDLSVYVYLDGVSEGTAETGLNRTDVTAAVPYIANPNVGFRKNFDYRRLAYGTHTLEVFVSAAGGPLLRVAQQPLQVYGPELKTPPEVPYAPVTALPLSSDPNISASLDGPAPGQSVLYNPLARLWLEFRNEMVQDFITQFAQIATSSCFGKSKIFAHQIAPSLYGGWNPELLAADASLRLNNSYMPGLTLYGGSAFGSAFLDMKERLNWGPYSVGEMHPMVPLTSSEYLAMFELHRTHGAVFVAPYYMLAQGVGGAVTGLSNFLIAPNNPAYGSDLYYQAIRNVMTQ
jgi:Beta-galactosidase